MEKENFDEKKDKEEGSEEKDAENAEMKNIKISMLVKNYLDSQGQKGETYNSLLKRLLKISSEGRYSDLEEKITKCTESNKIIVWKIRQNDYRNIAKFIYNFGYEDDDVKVDIREFQKGWGNGLYYSVNGITFAKILPQYESVMVGWIIEEKGKLVWGGMCTLKEMDDFDTHFYNRYSEKIREAYYLAKKIANGLGDKYITLNNKMATIEESIRKIQDELKTIKKKTIKKKEGS